MITAQTYDLELALPSDLFNILLLHNDIQTDHGLFKAKVEKSFELSGVDLGRDDCHRLVGRRMLTKRSVGRRRPAAGLG